VRRLFAICAIASLGVLPAIDFVYCPDGCTDTNRAQSAWRTDVASATGACGLCVNAVAVHCTVMPVQPVQRLTPLETTTVFDLAWIPPDVIDRPPRRS
jgi:hypothetical protein